MAKVVSVGTYRTAASLTLASINEEPYITWILNKLKMRNFYTNLVVIRQEPFLQLEQSQS